MWSWGTLKASKAKPLANSIFSRGLKSSKPMDGLRPKLTHEYWVWAVGCLQCFKMWIGCQDLKVRQFHRKIPTSSFSWQIRKSDYIEHSLLWELGNGVLVCRALPSSALTPSGCLTPSLPAWPLHILECYLLPKEGTSCRRHSERLGVSVGGVMTRKMGHREERRKPGIPEVHFVPFTKLPPSNQRLPWDWRASLRSPFTPCCSHSTEACVVMVRGKRHQGKGGF